MKRPALIPAIVVLLVVVGLIVSRGCRKSAPDPVPVVETELIPVASTETVVVPVAPEPEAPKLKPTAKPKAAVPATPQVEAPKVKIHKELIPKNIEIVRVYYQQQFMGPGSSVEFDINGTGFTKEFENMIKVESGHAKVKIVKLALVTPNQIHGTLVVDPSAETKVAFPQVLIKGNVVFQAADPFAVIRPGEVLTLMFIDMGESGRSGRIRVITNLTEQMYQNFKIVPSTPVIEISDMAAALPFIVDADLFIGPAMGGAYGLAVKLGEKTIWNKDGIIRVVQPNVGQSGLVQRAQVHDGFHRPGDTVNFTIQGSGFQPNDTTLLNARVKQFETTNSSFVYVAPGRMELGIAVPAGAAPGRYALTIGQGDQVLLDLADAFRVVDKNWMRGFQVEPALIPGGKSLLKISGRDLQQELIENLTTELDEPGLSLSSFRWVTPTEAVAEISATADVKPGDYLVSLKSGGKAIMPQFGNIVRVVPAP